MEQHNCSVETKQGSDVCPSCKSDSWKSAKMVVMEGTSFSDGKMEGSITNPGALTGIREFLLSDRWFSWDHKLDVDIEFSTRSGLVEVVKKFMVAQGSFLKMPNPPKEPEKLGFFKKIAPSKPTPPQKPTEPQEPQLPTPPETKPWYVHFLTNMLGIILLAIALFFYQIYKKGFTENLANGFGILLAVMIPIVFFRSFSKNKRLKLEHENEIKIIIEKHEDKMAKYRVECERFENYLKKHKFRVTNYHIELNRHNEKLEEEKKIIEEHKIALQRYEDEKSRVMQLRELLWDKTHICLRCGNAYFGRN